MGAGWRRWLLLLVPTGVAAALGTFAVVQHDQIREMKAELQGLAAEQRLTVPATDGSAMDSRRTALELPDERSEIARLRELLSLMEPDAATVARLEAENVKLKVDIAATWASMPPEIQEMVQARDRATAIQCVNNLKHLGVAARVYATDNGDEFPPDVLAMKDALSTPKMLVCPSDTARSAADSWTHYSPANLSYEFMSPGPGKHEFEPARVLFRCPIHGNIGMCDGSVQMGVAKEHPEWLVSRNGALYLEGRQEPTPGPAVDGGQDAVVPERRLISVETKGDAAALAGLPGELAKRYGLVPATAGVHIDGPIPGQAAGTQSFGLAMDMTGNTIKGELLPIIDANGNVIGVFGTGEIVPDSVVVPAENGKEPGSTQEPKP